MFVQRLSGSFNGGTYYTMEDRLPQGDDAAEHAPDSGHGSPEGPLDQGPDAVVGAESRPGSDGDHEEQLSRGRKATWEEKQLEYDDDDGGWQIKQKRKKKKKEKQMASPPPAAGETSSFSRIKSKLRGKKYGVGKKKEGRTFTLERVEEEQTLRAEEGEQEIVEVRVISREDQENRPPAEPKVLPNKEKLSPLREMFLKVVEDKAPVKERSRRSSLQLGKSKKKEKREERVEIHFDTKKSESEPCLLLKAAAQIEEEGDCAQRNVKKGEIADESWVFHQAKPNERRFDDDNLDYADAVEPGTVEAQRHVFKAKKIKKSRPCHVCHQPIVKLGSCCRVCKYLVHKACEPKVSLVIILL
ncbi:uncharacterized protein [Macrobrachium rosenbergii]|uniref:uncharacterized protein n=1 Tax=Macrobrachium rosenbergii TaxID=79674 RepID=UPI0034D4C1EC